MLGLYWERRRQQMRLPGFEDVSFDHSSQARWLIGDFYESLAAKQLTADLYAPKMRAHERGSLVPDLADIEHNILYEVKAASFPRCHFKVYVDQIESYIKFSKQEFPWDNPNVYYCFFGHGVSQIVDTCGSEMKLLSMLAKNTRYMVVVPLSIVELFVSLYPQERQACEGWSTLMRVPQKMLLNFQLKPARAFRLLEANMSEYSIITMWSKRSKAINCGVVTFPMTFVWKKGTVPPHLSQRKGDKRDRLYLA